MRHRRWLVFGAVLGIVLIGVWLAAANVSLSALPDPGETETYLATKAKRALVRRAAQGITAPPVTELSVRLGRMQYVAHCAACHGQDGRTASDIGRSMYPRASDLGSAQVQEWSDAELFWIIRHGLRMTGMPGFGKQLSDGEIWPLVHYLREIPKQPQE